MAVNSPLALQQLGFLGLLHLLHPIFLLLLSLMTQIHVFDVGFKITFEQKIFILK